MDNPSRTPVLRGFWRYYRAYTASAIHTAATAAMAIFGLLIFIDPWFALLAIVSYLLPPIVLFVRARRENGAATATSASSHEADDRSNDSTDIYPGSTTERERGTVGRDSDTDGARVGDADRVMDRDGDTDTDADGDTDTDSDADGDTDTDNDLESHD